MANYNDLYMRQALRQKTPTHAGGAGSPDIIPWGAAPTPDPSVFGTQASWHTDPGRALVAGADNYVYLRTANPTTLSSGCRLYAASAPPAFLCWPETLVPLRTESGQACAEIQVRPDEVGVAAEAFLCKPASAAASLAAWVATHEHPVELPRGRDVTRLYEFISRTPGYVQRSVAYGLDAGGKYRFRAGYDHGEVAAMMYFELAWKNCPKGWTVALLPVSGRADISIGPFDVVLSDMSLLCRAKLPAGFSSELEFAIDTHGIAPFPDTEVEVRVLLERDTSGMPGHDSGQKALYPLGGHRWRPAPDAMV